MGRLHLAGIETGLVLALESMGDDPAAWPERAREYVRTCRPTALIIGNEMDAYVLGVPSPSSWSLRPDEYRNLVGRVIAGLEGVWPRPILVGGGSVSGQPTWWDDVDPRGIGLQAIDIHPYGKDPEEARMLLRLYARHGLPLYVFEWSRAAEEIAAYATMLEEENIQAGCYFCWSDAMVPGFGLLDDQGNKHPEFDALMAAARV